MSRPSHEQSTARFGNLVNALTVFNNYMAHDVLEIIADSEDEGDSFFLSITSPNTTLSSVPPGSDSSDILNITPQVPLATVESKLSSSDDSVGRKKKKKKKDQDVSRKKRKIILYSEDELDGDETKSLPVKKSSTAREKKKKKEGAVLSDKDESRDESVGGSAPLPIRVRTKSTPMTELIRRVNSLPGSPFRSSTSSCTSAYSPLLKSSRSMLSRIAPLHPTRKPPPPPPPPIPKAKERKTKKMLEMEEKWEEELSETVEGWACLEESERDILRRRKKELELGGYDD